MSILYGTKINQLLANTAPTGLFGRGNNLKLILLSMRAAKSITSNPH